MNYPSPEILTIEPPVIIHYQAVPQYAQEFIFDDQNKFRLGRIQQYLQHFEESADAVFSGLADPANDDFSALLRPAASGPASPYALRVSNFNTVEMQVDLFDSYNARTRENFGASSGTRIESNIPGVTYAGLLAQTEHKNFKCDRVAIHIVSGAPAAHVFSRMATMKQQYGNGQEVTSAVLFLPKAQDVNPNICEAQLAPDVNINGYFGFRVVVPASTTLVYYFFPVAPALAPTFSKVETQLPKTLEKVRVIRTLPTRRTYTRRRK